MDQQDLIDKRSDLFSQLDASGVPAAGVLPPMEGYTASVDLDSETESNHDTALTLACAGGHEELVKLLLDRGADIGNLNVNVLHLLNYILLHHKAVLKLGYKKYVSFDFLSLNFYIF